jgi:hypothetical protein
MDAAEQIKKKLLTIEYNSVIYLSKLTTFGKARIISSLTVVFLHIFMLACNATTIAVHGNIRFMMMPIFNNKLLANANSDIDNS